MANGMEFAMRIALRDDFDAEGLRSAARKSKDPGQTRRLLALAAIYEGCSRTQAARIGGVTLQVVRDWVMKFNALGPDGLITRKAPGPVPRLNESHRAALVEAIEAGPDALIHGVVRWRLVDLIKLLDDKFAISISRQTVGRELRTLGYRKISARPKHHAQDREAVEAFKKGALPPSWRKSAKPSPQAPQ
jgi:transposase